MDCHGKSRTAGLLVEWVLGNDQTQKIMTGSYNETLSTMFSKSVRNDIQEEKADENRIVFSDIFPGVSIKRGDGAMNLWSLEGGYNNYLATSPTGTATGFGATLLIIDDLIKNSEEANNELTKEKHWNWFTDTMLSRLEEDGKIIIIMTRWASDDLAGRALEHFKEAGAKVRHISMKALQNPDTHEMLCPEVLSYKSYQAKIQAMGADIASANYQQEPIDLKGRLYTSFKTYSGELPQFKEIRNYTDTADTGEDYLCSINYGVTFANEAYVLDILYTKEPMEVTEPATARMLLEGAVNLARIESNNGGRGFARNVRRILEQELGSNYTTIKWFTQTQNKQARIYSNSSWVMQHIYYPEDWKNRWPEYHNAMIKYQREGQNKHDDAPDATTGIAENCAKKGGISVLK
nr:phage terminase large subunit [Enterocloster clostridioformis]